MTKTQKAEMRAFVRCLIENGNGFRDPSWIADGDFRMCVKEAYELIEMWKKQKHCLPTGITPYYLATLWDEMLKEGR